MVSRAGGHCHGMLAATKETPATGIRPCHGTSDYKAFLSLREHFQGLIWGMAGPCSLSPFLLKCYCLAWAESLLALGISPARGSASVSPTLGKRHILNSYLGISSLAYFSQLVPLGPQAGCSDSLDTQPTQSWSSFSNPCLHQQATCSASADALKVTLIKHLCARDKAKVTSQRLSFPLS